MIDSSTPQPLLFRPRWDMLGVGLLFAVVFLLFSYHYMQDTTSFNSDHLYCIHFCDDLLHGRDMHGWHLPAAPYIFPDMLLVFLASALTSNITAIFVLYGAMYYGLLAAVLMAILRGIGLPRREAFTIGCLSVTFLLAAHFEPVYVNRSLPMFHPGNHMGCMLVGLGVIAFILRAMRNGYTWLSAALLVVVCVLSGFSDQLLIVQCLAPVCAATLLLGLCRVVPFRRALVTNILLGVSALAAMKMRIVLVALGLMPMHITNLESDFPPDFSAVSAKFVASIWDAAHDQPLMWIVFIFHILAILTVLAMWARRPRRVVAEDTPALVNEPSLDRPAILLLALILLLAPAMNIAALIATATSHEAALLRYLHTCWLVPFLCVVLWSRLLPWRAGRLVPWAVVAVVAFRLATFPNALSVDHYTTRYTPLAQAIDDMVRKHGPMRGFSEYWRARELRYLTRSGVPVVPILSPGMPWFHGFNPTAYLSDDPHDLTIPEYQFVVLEPGKAGEPDPEQLLKRYGKPLEIIPARGFEIWRYDRMVSRQLDLFLRAQLAQRLVRNKPFVGPSEPWSLRKPKRNLTAWDDPKNIQLDKGGSLTLRFDKPVAGAMIDISAHYSDRYMLLFARDGKVLGSTRVPSVEWTGAEKAYSKPGLQSRLVQVPPACRTEGFNEVHVFPVGRSEHFSLGHFLVFDNWIPYQSGWERHYDRYHRYEAEKLCHPDSPAVTTIEDRSASNTHAQQATATFEGCLAYGPYTILAPGCYRAEFALKVEDNTSTDVVASIDSCAFGGEQILHSRPLRGVDFPSANQYTVFSFCFEADDELDLVEFRVAVHAKEKVTLDYVDVTRTATASTSDER